MHYVAWLASYAAKRPFLAEWATRCVRASNALDLVRSQVVCRPEESELRLRETVRDQRPESNIEVVQGFGLVDI